MAFLKVLNLPSLSTHHPHIIFIDSIEPSMAVLWWESSAPALTAPGARFAALAWREPHVTRMHRRTYRCHFRWWKHRSLEPPKFPRSSDDPSGCHVENNVAKNTHTQKKKSSLQPFFLGKWMSDWLLTVNYTTIMSQLAIILDLLLAGQLSESWAFNSSNVFQWKKSQGSAIIVRWRGGRHCS